MKRLKQYKSKNYKPQADILYFGLGGLPANFIPEIKVNYNRGKLFLGKVSKSDHVAEFIRNVYQAGTIQLQEYFIVLYLNQQNEIIGYYKHSVGAINATIVDQRIVFAVALTSLATSIILAHNHPSGNIKPSQTDKTLTEQIQQSGKTLNINVLDHIILTKGSHYSFADQGLI